MLSTSVLARARDERGGALVMVLVLIIVVSVTCVAALKFQNTGSRAQSIASESLRAPSVGADSALDAVIAQMRRADGYGAANKDGNPCTNPHNSSYNPSAVTSGPELVYSVPRDNTTTPPTPAIKVVCVPDSASGQPTGSTPALYSSVLTTMGGINSAGSPSASNVPFCDDRQGPGVTCEAGIYAGRARPNGDASVVIAGSNRRGPLVQSNSSVIVNDYQFPTSARYLQMDSAPNGSISARRECKPAGQFITNFDKGPPWSIAANADLSKCNRNGQLLNDPIADFHHSLWDQIDPATVCATTTGDVPASSSCGTLPASVPKQTLNINTLRNQCQNGFVRLYPGYYDDATPFNTLVSDSVCENAVVWLSPGTGNGPWSGPPGVYYFDFQAPNNVWGGQGGVTNHPLWIVGGTPPSATDPDPDVAANAWLPGSSSTLVQPTKHMWAHDVSLASASNWSATGSAEIAAQHIDGTSATANLPNSGTTVTVDAEEFGTAVNGNVNNGITKVGLTVAYATGTTTGSNAWTKRDLTVTAGTRQCTYTLPEGPYPVATPLAIDLTNGCPTNNRFPGGSAGTSWSAAIVNGLQVKIQFQERTNANLKPTVDGIDVSVDTRGPPSPSFPHACDGSKTGVQLIFGGASSMYFDQGGGGTLPDGTHNDSMWVDLCGSRDDYSRYGPTIYGLTDHPSEQNQAAVCCGTVGPPNYVDGLAPSPPAFTWFTGLSNFTYDANPGSLIAAPNDGKFLRAAPQPSGSWTSVDPNPAKVTYTLPANLVPSGSTIERVEFDVVHREGSAINYINLDVAPTSGVGSHWDTSKFKGGAWGFDNTRTPSIQGGIPTSPSWTTFKYGLYIDPADPSGTKINSNWKNERWPTDPSYLGSAASLNGARVTYSVNGTLGSANRWAELDYLSVHVVYRPPGTLRPLGGRAGSCGRLTLRPASPWQYDDTKDPWVAGKNTAYMTGTDRDFAANSVGSSLAPDDAYSTTTPSTSCPLLLVDGPMFSVEGAVYAPTAVIDVSGRTNHAPIVTNSVVARQFTETRYVTNDDKPLLGTDGSGVRLNDRSYTLWVYDNSDTTKPILLGETKVKVDDGAGFEPGKGVRVLLWIKRPGR